jgi:hypothetical protein
VSVNTDLKVRQGEVVLHETPETKMYTHPIILSSDQGRRWYSNPSQFPKTRPENVSKYKTKTGEKSAAEQTTRQKAKIFVKKLGLDLCLGSRRQVGGGGE